MRFIGGHADKDLGGLRWGVEPICAVLSEHGGPIAPSTYYAAPSRARTPSAREITTVHGDNHRVYGACKICLALNREGSPSLAAPSNG